MAIAPTAGTAQDLVFTHPLSAPQYTNPALAGTFGRYHVSAAVRSLFSASSSLGNTIYADADTYISQWNSSVGLYIMNDHASGGLFQTTSFGVAYSYNFRLTDELELRPALQAVIYLQQRNPQGLNFPDMVGSSGAIYPSGYESTSKTRADFTAGVVAQHPFFQAGVAVQHIGSTSSDSSVVYGEYPLKITFHGQANIGLSGHKELLPLKEWKAFENIVLLPQVKYIHQSDFQYLIAGATVRSGGLFAGVAVKTPLQTGTYLAALSLGLDSRSLKVGYSFDFITAGASLRGWNSGSHEVFIHYSFGEPEERSSFPKTKRRKRIDPTCGCPY